MLSHKADAQEFLPFTRPEITETAIQEVARCLREGWIASGPQVQRLEKRLADYVQAPYASLLTSATAGLHLSLLALGVGPGDEVITTPLTFIATLNVIALCGAKPVLVDIDPITLNIEADAIASRLSPKTKVILPVHFAGRPVDMDPLLALAKAHHLPILEDAAHAIGSRYRGTPIGGFGHHQVFSFHPCKNLTTAEGGCVTSRDENFIQKINRLRFHGQDRETWNRYKKEGSQVYDVIEPGYKYNMSDLQATIGLDQLDHLEENNGRRRRIVQRYYDAFSGWESLNLPPLPHHEEDHSWHIFTPLIRTEVCGVTREAFIEKMKESNIGIGLHYPAAHSFTYYRDTFGYRWGDFPVAEHVSRHIVSLPLFPSLSIDQQDRVIDAMAQILQP